MAARFWVGGTGTWDASDTTHWSATSGGAGGQSVPTSADTVTLDGSSGGGTVTVSHASLSINTLTFGAFTGTLDFAANDNNVAIGAGGVSGTGTGTRTFNMGDGTWTLAAGASFSFATITNLTFAANGSTLVLTQVANTIHLLSGAIALNIVSVIGAIGGQTFFSNGGNQTIVTLNYTPPGSLIISNGSILTITNGLNISGGSLTNMFQLAGSSTSGATAITSANNSTVSFCVVHDVVFNGGGVLTANNSVSLGHTTGVTVNVPTSGGTGVIGS